METKIEHNPPTQWMRCIIISKDIDIRVSFVPVLVRAETDRCVEVDLVGNGRFAWLDKQEAGVYPDVETCKKFLLWRAGYKRDAAASEVRYWEAVASAVEHQDITQ